MVGDNGCLGSILACQLPGKGFLGDGLFEFSKGGEFLCIKEFENLCFTDNQLNFRR